MARVANLHVNLALEDASFVAGLKRATRRTDEAMGKVSRSVDAATSAFKAFASAISVGALAQGARAITQFADSIATAAERAGTTAESYQRMRGALRALELDTQQTDKVLEKLVLTLGDMQAGTAAAGVSAALDRMGIAGEIAAGRISGTDELLDALAQASSRYATQAQFAADISAIVGDRLGPKLAAALAQGAEAYRQLGANVTVATDAQIEQLARANEAWDKFLETIQTRALIAFATVLERAQMLASALGSEGVGGLFNGRVQERLAGSMQDALLRDKFPLPRARASLLPAGSRAAPLASSLRAGRRSSVESGEAVDRSPIAARLPISLAGEEPLSDYGSRLKMTFDSVEATAAIIKQSIAEWQQPLSRAEDFARGISDNLAYAIVNGQNIGKALVNSFKSAAAEAIASGLFKLLLGEGGTGGLIGKVFGALGGLGFGGARASGGPISPGKAYLVGERGPELIVPRQAGTVIPNGGFGGGQMVFDLRGAVVTEDLLQQINDRVALGYAAAVGTSRADMRQAQRPRLPRARGAG